MLQLVLLGVAFQVSTRVEFPLSLQSPGWGSAVCTGQHFPLGGFPSAQIVPVLLCIFSIPTFFSPPTLQTPGRSSLLLQAGGSSSLSLSSPDPPHKQTHRAAGPGFNRAQVLPHVAGTDLRRVSLCHLVPVLTQSNSAQSSSARPSQMCLSAFPNTSTSHPSGRTQQ